ncbi:hypothetical protein EXIGLDRAFT_841320 [Exidia glandulosa HHB12029]|uniref:Uncharacterized protein n=1 Tax=Exidia glandulosa HHB12029 TaxID=1314781 RepID=A0A165ZT06_EXIGL|nr:hypothetical protein EXIGLDRAFT_841320 [Exidia glandulosa HHB12029]
MFIVPLSAYAGYPHRNPLADDVGDELDLTSVARERYVRAVEEEHDAKRAYAASIATTHVAQLEELGLALALDSHSHRHSHLHAQTSSHDAYHNHVAAHQHKHHQQVSEDERLLREASAATHPSTAHSHSHIHARAHGEEHALHDDLELERKRHAIVLEQARLRRVHAREKAFAQALIVAHELARQFDVSHPREEDEDNYSESSTSSSVSSTPPPASPNPEHSQAHVHFCSPAPFAPTVPAEIHDPIAPSSRLSPAPRKSALKSHSHFDSGTSSSTPSTPPLSTSPLSTPQELQILTPGGLAQIEADLDALDHSQPAPLLRHMFEHLLAQVGALEGGVALAGRVRRMLEDLERDSDGEDDDDIPSVSV